MTNHSLAQSAPGSRLKEVLKLTAEKMNKLRGAYALAGSVSCHKAYIVSNRKVWRSLTLMGLSAVQVIPIGLGEDNKNFVLLADWPTTFTFLKNGSEDQDECERARALIKQTRPQSKFLVMDMPGSWFRMVLTSPEIAKSELKKAESLDREYAANEDESNSNPSSSADGPPGAFKRLTKQDLKEIPLALKSRVQWVVWRFEFDENGKPTKVPYQAQLIKSNNWNISYKASSNKPETWSEFDTSAAVALNCTDIDGIGFCFSEGDGLVGIDLDHCCDPLTGEITPEAQKILDQFAGRAYIERSVSGDGFHIWFLSAGPTADHWTGKRGCDSQGKKWVELYNCTSARYFTVSGRIVDDISTTELQDCTDALEWLIERHPKHEKKATSGSASGSSQHFQDVDWSEVRRALPYLKADDYGQWCQILCALKSAGAPQEIFEDWSKTSAEYVPGDEDKWHSFNKTEGELITIATLFFLAKQNGFVHRRSLDDIGNGQRFVDKHGHAIQYAPALKQLFVYDGTRWKPEPMELTLSMAKTVARGIYKEAADEEDEERRKSLAKWANKSASAKSLKAMVELARCELLIEPELLDQHKWLLNCQNGTIDLRTGELVPHDPDHLLTMMAPVVFDPNATSPRFDQFLAEIFLEDQGLLDFAQMAAGYILTGETKAQDFNFNLWFGDGENGKGLFLRVLLKLMGDYATTADSDLLVKKRERGASNDLAALRGKRLVAISESNLQDKFDEARLKKITGEDDVACRFLYGEVFNYEPQFKIVFLTNHRPEVSQDKAIWRRIKSWPFDASFPFGSSARDEDLFDKLKTEFPGILAWSVKGCLLWQRDGFKLPERVQAATKEYREEQDTIAQFFADCTKNDASYITKHKTLYYAYKHNCELNGQSPISSIAFGKTLERKGFDRTIATDGNKAWTGIKLITDF